MRVRVREKKRKREEASVAELERAQGELVPGASRRSAEQAVLPIGWHCVQRRGARPSSALIVFPRRVSSRLGGARRFPPLSVPAGMLRRVPHRTAAAHLLFSRGRSTRSTCVGTKGPRATVPPPARRGGRNSYMKFDDVSIRAC